MASSPYSLGWNGHNVANVYDARGNGFCTIYGLPINCRTDDTVLSKPKYAEVLSEAQSFVTAVNERATLLATNAAMFKALWERDDYAAACPLDKKRVSDADRKQCSVCGATAGESCVRKGLADDRFTQAARALLASVQP